MLAALLLAALAAAEPEDPCPGRATSVVVDVKARTLWLCEGGASVESFRVATGWSGTPKKMEGDGKTPLGVYPLGAPQESDDWLWLIPVGYPTEEQRRLRYSGGNIGIHGPSRAFRWLRSVNTWLDWTSGGIAVGTDGEIERIALWVREKRPAEVEIR